jgi:hypothetical protein
MGFKMNFLRELVSKKLMVTAAAVGLIQTLHMSADWKGIVTAAVAFAYVLAQAYVDASAPTQPPPVSAPPKEQP